MLPSSPNCPGVSPNWVCFVFSLKVAAGAVVVSECELHGDITIGKNVKYGYILSVAISVDQKISDVMS